MDVKEFKIMEESVRIAQIFTLDKESVLELKSEILSEMKKIREAKGNDTFVFVVTDIFDESSIVFVCGEYGVEIAGEFGEKIEENEFFAPGLLSRKKQMVPKVTDAIKKAKEN